MFCIDFLETKTSPHEKNKINKAIYLNLFDINLSIVIPIKRAIGKSKINITLLGALIPSIPGKLYIKKYILIGPIEKNKIKSIKPDNKISLFREFVFLKTFKNKPRIKINIGITPTNACCSVKGYPFGKATKGINGLRVVVKKL